MPVSAAYAPDAKFAALGADFADAVAPASFPEQILRFRNDRAAATVGLEGLSKAEWLSAFAAFEPLRDSQPGPLAMRYHGHQFRTYNPDLGDGRGFLYAQLREVGSGWLLDLATKGSGRTPWSRTADGRLTLKGGVREVLAAEMLEALGVPTSRAFSLIETGESLSRGDEPSPTRSAVLTRLSHSHIRFGTFQRLAYLGETENLRKLLDHAIEVYHPHTTGPASFLSAVVEASAKLTARWMAAGFVHGVLNTDNMNITGESFDYGPWRFLPKSDARFTAAYFDHSGLYAYGRQPEAVFWNLQQLAAALTPLEDEAPLIAALNGFEAAYIPALIAAMIDRLGIKPRGMQDDAALINSLYRALGQVGEAVRWEPFFFDWFGGQDDRALGGLRGGAYQGPAFEEFRWLIASYEPANPLWLSNDYFLRPEPEEMLIEEVEAIWAPIAECDDWSAFEAKIARVRKAGEAYGIGAKPPYPA